MTQQLYTMSPFIRIFYKRKNKNSCKYKEYGFFSDVCLGYPESDEHFRKRILEYVKK